MIGQKIAILRTCRGFSQEYMASRLGIKQNTYSGYEQQDAKIADDTLLKISEILGVSVEDIKNPMPIFMNFTNSPNSNSINTNNNSQETVNELLALLKKKDEQIDRLIEKLK